MPKIKVTQLEFPFTSDSLNERIRYCKIKSGATVFQNFKTIKWTNGDVVFQAKKDNILFNQLRLVATGYGRLDIKDAYGNGSLLGHEMDVIDVYFKGDADWSVSHLK